MFAIKPVEVVGKGDAEASSRAVGSARPDQESFQLQHTSHAQLNMRDTMPIREFANDSTLVPPYKDIERRIS